MARVKKFFIFILNENFLRYSLCWGYDTRLITNAVTVFYWDSAFILEISYIMSRWVAFKNKFNKQPTMFVLNFNYIYEIPIVHTECTHYTIHDPISDFHKKRLGKHLEELFKKINDDKWYYVKNSYPFAFSIFSYRYLLQIYLSNASRCQFSTLTCHYSSTRVTVNMFNRALSRVPKACFFLICWSAPLLLFSDPITKAKVCMRACFISINN